MNVPSVEVEVLLIGGGGGGGQIIAGGGGAGGVITGSLKLVPNEDFKIFLGAGGNGSIDYSNNDNATSGTLTQLSGSNNAVFNFTHLYVSESGTTHSIPQTGSLIANGGGHGSGWNGSNYARNEINLGSGGGGSGQNDTNWGNPGFQTTKRNGPPGANGVNSYVLGNAGGQGSSIAGAGSDGSGGGGGGATSVGANGTDAQGGAGGSGIMSRISGSMTGYAGGGGGGTRSSTGNNYGSGSHGGGRGGYLSAAGASSVQNIGLSANGYAENGADGKGGGGGGGGYSSTGTNRNSGNGGSGTAIFRMPAGTYNSGSSDTGVIAHHVETVGSDEFDVIRFTSSGVFQVKLL